MKKAFTGLVISLISLSVFAEKIDGPANARINENGIKVLSLFDNVDVDCSELHGDWYQIGVYLKISESQYESKIPIKMGDTLINWNNEKIGIALIDIPDSIFSTWYSGGAPGNPKRFGMEIYCFSFKSNIRPESIVEPVLTNLILTNKEHLTLDIFKNHFEVFNYSEGLKIPDYNDLKSFMIYENAIDDPSPLDRVRLIFENEKLIGIVHSRELKLNGYETFEMPRSRKLTLIKQYVDSEKDKFIEANKKAYWGVD